MSGGVSAGRAMTHGGGERSFGSAGLGRGRLYLHPARVALNVRWGHETARNRGLRTETHFYLLVGLLRLEQLSVCDSQEVLLRRYAFEFCCPFQELNLFCRKTRWSSFPGISILILGHIELKCLFKSDWHPLALRDQPIWKNCLSKTSFRREHEVLLRAALG